jgi:hypothetical protein
MRTFNKKIASAAPLNTTFNSTYVPLKSIYTYSVAINITGTPTGTITLQASNDPETNDTQTNSSQHLPGAVPPTNWATIANTSQSVTTSGTTLYNVADIGYNFVRVTYTDGSSGASTAVADIVVNCKGI